MTYHNAHAARLDEHGIVQQVIVIPFLNDNDDEITAYCNSLGLVGRRLRTTATFVALTQVSASPTTLSPTHSHHHQNQRSRKS
jgi:hypothetical protein